MYKDKNYIATGIDSKGRLQYIYPKKFKKKTSSKKYSRIERLSKRKDMIIDKIIEDAKKGNVEAQAIYTMYKTGFRPGSDKDTKAEKKAFGTITLLKKQVKLKPHNIVSFDFIGKKGVRIKKDVKDKLLADVMKERKDDPKIFDTSNEDVRSYFDKRTNNQFKLKDLRTLKAFDVADEAIGSTKLKDPKEIKKEVIHKVSMELGNTPSIAASAYIAPKIEQLKNEKKKEYIYVEKW